MLKKKLKKKNLLVHGEHRKGILASQVHCLSSMPKKKQQKKNDEKSIELSNFTIFVFKLLVATYANIFPCIFYLAAF